PYFRKQTKEEVEKEVESIATELAQGNPDPLPDRRMIVNAKDELLGEVNWYWKSEETNWLEIGLVIFDENNWGQGIGYKALRQWINVMFQQRPEVVRIGLTTWSGNTGMMRLAEKLGLEQEACYRKARIVAGKYYDSLSYGILRAEWESKAREDGI
ncbi:MAG: GNAT family protein, partial [Bacteroidota bacterium]